jgi:hypothetical protein
MMTGNKKKTATELENTYKSINVAIPYSIKKISKDTYKFDVYYVDE